MTTMVVILAVLVILLSVVLVLLVRTTGDIERERRRLLATIKQNGETIERLVHNELRLLENYRELEQDYSNIARENGYIYIKPEYGVDWP